ncbi:hypothetical protein GS597_07295 [Synechococcales cyanobacterium C]|uniref:2TM domain-containing protein n=1 Tax=Petrachloros mirabilis ULC683 TaxID=2781853 RepID=A0A8K2A6U0_9CYAN|nr:2TM domain-containing protein [Petrachloros mirabilis]NCJ06319.1 hypothetical protein [Petrachloros mirabilis ULC683]
MDYPYTASDVQAILGRALAQQHHNEFSEAQLGEMAQELGIGPANLEQAKCDWLAEQQEAELRRSFDRKQRQDFKSHWITYMIVNAFLVGLNIVTPDSHPWSLYPLLGWGMVVMLDAAATFKWIDHDDYQKAFKKWKKKHKRLQD